MNLLLVFLGSGLGGFSRYVISNMIYHHLGRHFPWGTLLVNASGCLLMGIFYTLLLTRFASHAPQIRLFLLVGFLGGYSTFSSFALETWNFLESGALFLGIMNIVSTTALCLIFTWIGLIWGRLL
jgi:CrcB protein